MENIIDFKNHISKYNSNLRDFTVSRNNDKLYPWQVTGLTDAEGSFAYSLIKPKLDSNIHSTKIKFNLEFKITQKNHSEGILHELKDYFGCGSIIIDNRKTETKKFQVKSLDSILNKVIPHFEKYPCLTSKQLNFMDWKKIAFIMYNKEHLTTNGMQEIINLISRINKKRSFQDKFNFCNSTLALKSLSKDLSSVEYDLDPYWVQTFITSEGLFYNYVSETESKNFNTVKIDSSLEIGQNSHEIAILIALQKFFKGGYIKPKYNYTNLSDCIKSRLVNRFIYKYTDSIIKFVDQYPMLTRKHLDYLDWKKIVEMKNNNLHKTKNGLELIIQIKNNMNSKRDVNYNSNI
uniref:LAGLIDADG endonuclease n=1 Tax=Inonotus hispidus TaxID=40469 RepID=UPI0021822C19|nr:LAGLIDADG endonuclease [Inonotus hispidus]YP_010691080.1 LAGLIDADG endonuclease [Phellinus igniarius]UVF38001.1 LAGLIDADG endonuclease [Inonotus hispidus]WBU93181.1 LAGLIDADG endonuclease [Phellinus igniarius]